MPNPRMKHRRVVHKSTAGILKPIPEAVDLVGNPPPGLTTHTVALLHRRVSANRRSRLCFLGSLVGNRLAITCDLAPSACLVLGNATIHLRHYPRPSRHVSLQRNDSETGL